MTGSIYGPVHLRYNGDLRDPSRRGFIPGVTPPPGVNPGTDIEITDEMLSALNRPTGDEACGRFAWDIAGRYNANLGYQKWSPVIDLLNVDPDHVQSEESASSPEQAENTVTDMSARTNSDEGE